MRPRHFHIVATGILGIAAIIAGLYGHWGGSGFLALGAIVALIHWKAAKSGLEP